MQIRPADASDSAAIAGLLGELGYPTTGQQVSARFARVDGSETDAAWLVISAQGDPIGFAAGHRNWLYEHDRPVAELTALVVAQSGRRTGAGRALVRAFEEWCTDSNCLRASVASALRRADAHAFYEALGYTQLAKKFDKTF